MHGSVLQSAQITGCPQGRVQRCHVCMRHRLRKIYGWGVLGGDHKRGTGAGALKVPVTLMPEVRLPVCSVLRKAVCLSNSSKEGAQ